MPVGTVFRITCSLQNCDLLSAQLTSVPSSLAKKPAWLDHDKMDWLAAQAEGSLLLKIFGRESQVQGEHPTFFSCRSRGPGALPTSHHSSRRSLLAQQGRDPNLSHNHPEEIPTHGKASSRGHFSPDPGHFSAQQEADSAPPSACLPASGSPPKVQSIAQHSSLSSCKTTKEGDGTRAFPKCTHTHTHTLGTA